MIKKAAIAGASWLCVNGVIEDNKDKIYAYGLELLLSGILNVLCVLLLSKRPLKILCKKRIEKLSFWQELR